MIKQTWEENPIGRKPSRRPNDRTNEARYEQDEGHRRRSKEVQAVCWRGRISPGNTNTGSK